MPAPADSLVLNLKSSNTENPAIFIDRPVEAQGPFYYEVDGSSDNTFDALPPQLEDAGWIATKRLSDPKNMTDLSFTIANPATVFVMYSTGTFPASTLKQPDENTVGAAKLLTKNLLTAGFKDAGIQGTWRGHDLWLAHCGLMIRTAKAGESIAIPGQTLDYVILVKPM